MAMIPVVLFAYSRVDCLRKTLDCLRENAVPRLLVFSDGVTETYNPAGEEFAESRLVALAVKKRDLGAEELQAAILAELERYAAGTRASDDRTMIVLKRR